MTAADPGVHSLTGAYACHALNDTERAAFEQHLAECPTCAQEVAELRETVACLALATAETPPPRLKASVDSAISRVRQVPPLVAEPVVRAASRRRRRGSRESLGWGVAVMMSIVVAALGVRVAEQQDRITAADRQSAAISAVAAAPDAHADCAAVRTGGTAVVMVSRSRDEAAITLTGLMAPPPGQVYQLWMMGSDGTRSGGIVRTTAQGSTGSVVADGLGETQTIGLTLEPAHGSPQPTTPLLLRLPMPA